jgi:hypothetical protein
VLGQTGDFIHGFTSLVRLLIKSAGDSTALVFNRLSLALRKLDESILDNK